MSYLLFLVISGKYLVNAIFSNFKSVWTKFYSWIDEIYYNSCLIICFTAYKGTAYTGDIYGAYLSTNLSRLWPRSYVTSIKC